MFSLVAAFLVSSALPAADLNDGIDRNDPNFVKASLVVVGPGDELFSCAGHVALRLECPTFKLDNCFSYESESVRDRIWTFLRGKLKMGMFAMPTDLFLREYAASGRGVRQYPLNLPPTAKQRLWQILDQKVAEGANLPYDYDRRGCAKTMFDCLRQALSPAELVVPDLERAPVQTGRALIASSIADHPWNLFVVNTLMGTAADHVITGLGRAIIPGELLSLLRRASVRGTPLVAGEVELLPRMVRDGDRCWLSPLGAAFLLLGISGIACFTRCAPLDLSLLAFQVLVGLFLCYLVFCSELPATDWNWLLVPFNPLPLLFWKWRTRWAAAFAGVLLLWLCATMIPRDALTDWPHAVLALSFALFYLKFTKLPGLIRAQRSSHDA